MSEIFALEASFREVVGKQVKQLRRAGQIPAVVYGPDFTPINISIPEKPLRQTLLKAGGTRVIELKIGDQVIPTLVRKVQRDILRGDLLHVDFYRVSMDRPIRAEVPLVLVNESPAVESGEAIVVQHLTSLEVEALAVNLPPHIEIDLSGLTKVDDHLMVGDLALPETVKIITDADELILKLDYPEVEELEEVEEVAADSVEVITERKRAEEEEE